jgi:transcription antitermination protein NusB
VKKNRRSRGREAALQILYQREVGGVPLDDAIATVFDHQWPDEGGPSEAVRTFASALARATVAELADIDRLIEETAERWRPSRMPVVDRLILRLAVAELITDTSTPPPVVINEALELARTYSTEDAVKFINGMLDAVRRKREAT